MRKKETARPIRERRGSRSFAREKWTFRVRYDNRRDTARSRIKTIN